MNNIDSTNTVISLREMASFPCSEREEPVQCSEQQEELNPCREQRIKVILNKLRRFSSYLDEVISFAADISSSPFLQDAGASLVIGTRVISDLTLIFSIKTVLDANKENRKIEKKIVKLLRELEESNNQDEKQRIEEKIEFLWHQQKTRVLTARLDCALKTLVITSRISSFAANAIPVLRITSSIAGRATGVVGGTLSVINLRNDVREAGLIQRTVINDTQHRLQPTPREEIVNTIMQMRLKILCAQHGENTERTVKNSGLLTTSIASLAATIMVGAGLSALGGIGLCAAAGASLIVGGGYTIKSIYTSRHNINHSTNEFRASILSLLTRIDICVAQSKTKAIAQDLEIAWDHYHSELNKMRKLSEELNDKIGRLENKTEIETLVRSKIQLIEEINGFEQHQKGVIQELETAYIASLNSANQAELRKKEFDEAKSVLSQQYKVQRLALYRGECPADTFKMLQEFATSLDQNPEASRQMREEVERVSLDPEEYDKNAVM